MQPVGGRIPFYKLGAYKSRKFFRINKFYDITQIQAK